MIDNDDGLSAVTLTFCGGPSGTKNQIKQS